MHFPYAPTQEEKIDELRANVADLLPHRQAAVCDKEPFTSQDWEICGRLGMLGLAIPTTHGGQGLDMVTTARMVEAFSESCGDTGLSFSVSAHLFACAMPIAERAHAEVQEAMLPGLCSGKLIGANAITEKEAGSDVFSLKTTAIRDGDHYVLNGTKSWVTNAPTADVFVVYGMTNPAFGFMGLNGFVVERDTPGLRVDAPFRKAGLDSAQAAAVHFQDCRVPVENRLGQEGQGGSIFRESMQWERAGLFASYTGAMRRQLERVISHAKHRKQFGKKISANQAVSHRIARMKLRLEAARLLLLQACSKLDQGEEATMEVSMAKIAVSEAALESSIDAMRVFGGAGYAVQNGIECNVRDAMGGLFASGTSEMQLEIIAQELKL